MEIKDKLKKRKIKPEMEYLSPYAEGPITEGYFKAIEKQKKKKRGS